MPAGEFFFDRNPRAFEVILEFYRTGEIIPNPSIPKRLMDKEIEFWQLHKVTREKPHELDAIVNLVINHVNSSAEDPPRDLIVSRKALYKDGDDSLAISEFGWTFRVFDDCE
jgi:hypothetical protein